MRRGRTADGNGWSDTVGQRGKIKLVFAVFQVGQMQLTGIMH